MDTFVVTMTAKPGSDAKVADFYLKQQSQYEAVKGFRGRQVLMSRPGTMADILRQHMTPEEMAKHPEPEAGSQGAHFVVIEQWDSAEDRMAWSLSRDKTADKELFPHLLPAHTHEFYDDLTSK